MRRPIVIAALALLPLVADAQEGDDDKGYLTTLLQDSLSGSGRIVDIQGFAGALSSTATIERLTIADDDGVWLVLEGVTMQWTRSALLLGRVEIGELAADHVDLLRPPVAPAGLPAPEATPFSLPELPVALSLGALTLTEIDLGPDFLGEAVTLHATGSAALADGEGTADLRIDRKDGARGQLDLAASYDNASGMLDVALALSEDRAGIAARLIGLPGEPALDLSVIGSGQIADYSARLQLATDGAPRLAGTFGLVTTPAAPDQPDALPQHAVTLDLAGDVSSLFLPDYQDFFGPDIRLRAAATRGADGGYRLSRLDLTARALHLSGQAEIGADGWPARLALTGELRAPDGAAVLLPLPGEATRIGAATISLGFDQASGPDWQLDLNAQRLTRADASLDLLSLTGSGRIEHAEAGAPAAFTASFDYGGQGIALGDAGLSAALGDTIAGHAELSRSGGGPLDISTLTLSGAGIDADAVATVSGFDTGLAIDGTALVSVLSLERFAAISGLDLAGGGSLAVSGRYAPLDGTFAGLVTGQTQDLALGIAHVDPLLAGAGEIAISATRDTTGTRIDGLTVDTAALHATGRVDLTSAAMSGDLDARLTDLGLILPGLSGPATARGSASYQQSGALVASLTLDGPGLAASASARQDDPANGGPVAARIDADLADLAPFSGLAGQDLGGAAKVSVDGVFTPDLSGFVAAIEAQTTDLALGLAGVDPVLAGTASLAANIGRRADLSVSLDATFASPTTAATLKVTAPELATDASFETTATLRVDDLSVLAGLAGLPLSGAIDATMSGSLSPAGAASTAILSLQSQDVALGIAAADTILAGRGRLDVAARRDADGTILVHDFGLETDALTVTGQIAGAGTSGTADFTARLANIGLLVPEFSGALTATGSAARSDAGVWSLNAGADGPAGTAIRIAGSLGADRQAAVDVSGQVPLAFANPLIAPRRLSGLADLALGLDGPLALTSLNGRVSTSGAELSAPLLGQSVTGINASVALAGGRAVIDLTGNVAPTGRVALSGPVTLSAPYVADLRGTLDNLVLRDPQLYQTSLNGSVALSGPLAGGAVISGTIDLGETNVQVPSSAIGALGELPDVTHVAPPPAVRRTLDRAGLTTTETAATGPRRPFPLDIRINAPSRIFIRGRGLDAELGGSLVISGTSANVIPIGRFSLIRGRLDILQQRFELTEGLATLEGGFVPQLRLIAATTSRSGTNVIIALEGEATEPVVTFSSNPELPQDEILAQLIFGRDLGSISPLQAVQLASAVGTLAGRGGGGLVDSFRSGIGLDDLDLTTDAAGNAGLRAGKYLGENLYTDVELGSDGTSQINLNLDLTGNLTAKGSAGTNGDTSIGLFFERDY